jgi:hypothetical protein
VQLSRKHQQLTPGLDNDAPHVPARSGHDIEGFTFGSQAHFIAKARQLVRLVEPGLTPLLVLIEEARNTHRKLRSIAHSLLIGQGAPIL